MANRSPYKSEGSSPLMFHAHHRGYLQDLPFWLGLAEEAGEPILELGCGTGRVLIPMIEAGHNAYGLDQDAGALALLRERLPAGLEERAHLFQADLTAFHLAARFPLILAPCNTYSTLNAEARQAVLGCIQRQLAPGGIFAASLPNPGLLNRLVEDGETEVEGYFPHPQSENPVQVSSAWERGAGVFTLHWYYDHLLPDGRVERETISTRHHIVPMETYLAEIRAAALSTLEVYGDFDRSPYEGDAPHSILLARRG